MAERLLHVVDWGGAVGFPFGSGPYVVVPNDHNITRFNLLARRRNLNVEAWFTARAQKGLEPKLPETEWSFKHRWVPTMFLPRGRISVPIPLFPNGKPDVYLSSYAEPSLLGVWIIASVLGLKRALYLEATTSSAWFHRTRLKEAIKRRVIPNADGILTQGPDGARYVRRYGAVAKRIHYVRHGMPLRLWDGLCHVGRPQRDSLRADLGLTGTTFIYVGRLWTGKGLDYLLEAFAMVEARYAGKVSLLMVGKGPDEQHLRRRVRELGCQKVTFAGYVDETARLAAIYSAADVFVFPSLGDPYGVVLDEAMACQLPIIASSGIGEVDLRVQEGDNGFVVAPRDSSSLADRMQRFVTQPELKTHMGERSRQLIDTRTIERWANEFEMAIERIALDGNGRR